MLQKILNLLSGRKAEPTRSPLRERAEHVVRVDRFRARMVRP